MDKPNGKSFASLLYDKLRKYKLPDLMDLMENPIKKHKWKTFAIWFVHTDLSLYNSKFYSAFVL
jgi:hypothetical protein